MTTGVGATVSGTLPTGAAIGPAVMTTGIGATVSGTLPTARCSDVVVVDRHRTFSFSNRGGCRITLRRRGDSGMPSMARRKRRQAIELPVTGYQRFNAKQGSEV
jgi:hypothetical protein